MSVKVSSAVRAPSRRSLDLIVAHVVADAAEFATRNGYYS